MLLQDVSAAVVVPSAEASAKDLGTIGDHDTARKRALLQTITTQTSGCSKNGGLNSVFAAYGPYVSPRGCVDADVACFMYGSDRSSIVYRYLCPMRTLLPFICIPPPSRPCLSLLLMTGQLQMPHALIDGTQWLVPPYPPHTPSPLLVPAALDRPTTSSIRTSA